MKTTDEIKKLAKDYATKDLPINSNEDMLYSHGLFNGFIAGFNASQSKPQLNIEKIVSGIVDSLGDTSEGNDYHIHSVNGNRWITHKEIGSGEPLKQWLKSEIEKHIEQSKPQEITSLEDANKNLRERHSIALDTIEELKEEIAGHEKMRKRAAEVVVDLSNKLSKAKEELEQIKTDTKTVDAVDALIVLTFDKHGHISGVNAPDKVVIMKTLDQFAESGYNGNFDNDSYYTLESIYIESKNIEG